MTSPPHGALCLPPWLRAAFGDLEAGVMEYAGDAHHPRIQEMLESVRFGSRARDEIPWCSAAVNLWVEKGSGLIGTRSGLARSWLEWGREIFYPPMGAVVVLSRGADPRLGHVGLYMGPANFREDGDVESVLVLGGNQSNQVTIQDYAAGRVLGYRWPDLEAA